MSTNKNQKTDGKYISGRVTGIISLALLFSILPISQLNAVEDEAINSKKLFVIVETVRRLGIEEQKQHIPQIYQEVFPSLRSLKIIYCLSFAIPSIPQKLSELPPEELANNILAWKNNGLGFPLCVTAISQRTNLSTYGAREFNLTSRISSSLKNGKQSIIIIFSPKKMKKEYLRLETTCLFY